MKLRCNEHIVEAHDPRAQTLPRGGRLVQAMYRINLLLLMLIERLALLGTATSFGPEIPARKKVHFGKHIRYWLTSNVRNLLSSGFFWSRKASRESSG